MIDEFNIRLGSLSNLNWTFRVKRAVFSNYSWPNEMIKSEFFKVFSSKSYVYRLNDIIVDFARITIRKAETYLSEIELDPNYQQKRFGLKLLKKILKQNSKIKSVFFKLKYFNIPALKLYEQVGFKK